MTEECCICHKVLPNTEFPLYKRYMNHLHQPCESCWENMSENDRMQTIERLDKALEEYDRVRQHENEV